MNARSIRVPWWNESRKDFARGFAITVVLFVLGYAAFNFLAMIWVMTAPL